MLPVDGYSNCETNTVEEEECKAQSICGMPGQFTEDQAEDNTSDQKKHAFVYRADDSTVEFKALNAFELTGKIAIKIITKLHLEVNFSIQ